VPSYVLSTFRSRVHQQNRRQKTIMERVTRSGNKLQRKRRFRQPSPPPGQGIDQHLHSKRPKNSSPKSSPSAASPLRVAGSSSNPSPDEGASTAEEERKKKKKIRGKRAELEDLLRCDGYAGAAAATELRRRGLTASIRRKGSWKGGIELSYRLGIMCSFTLALSPHHLRIACTRFVRW